MVKFLSLVHLNTVVGLQSQAFAYSHSLRDVVRYLGIPSQMNNFHFLLDTDRHGNEKQFFESFSQKRHGPRSRKAFVIRCWIITHPTSNVFLTSWEILQLYKYTCENKDCFCIVLSPRNRGMKVLSVQLTEEGFDEVKRLEEQITISAITGMECKDSMLERSISKSRVDFYRQIPFSLIQMSCVYNDLRVPDYVQKQLQSCLRSEFAHDIW